MSRINLLLLQVLVAVVSVALWYVLTTYPDFRQNAAAALLLFQSG